MFRFMRKSEVVKKYLLIFFLGIVSVGMVITLAPLPNIDSTTTQGNVIATIGGENITTQQLDKNIRDRLQSAGARFDPRTAATVVRPILDGMIERRAVVMQAKRMGLDVSDQEVVKVVQAIPGFFPDGKFIGDDRFQQVMGMTVTQFLSEQRQDLLVQKMFSIVTDGVHVAPGEVHDQFVRANTKARIEYVVFDPSQFLKAVEITPKALEDTYKSHPEKYRRPEQRKVRYVLITQDRIRAEVKVTDQELKQEYSQRLADYRVPDRVHVARILFKTTGKTPKEIADLQTKAQGVLDQIKAGGDFADLAAKNSEDASANKGGDVGWIQRGQTVKEFEDVAFSLQPGQTSGLIKTDYGIDIIKVLEKQVAHLQTFDEVKDQLRAAVEKRKLADAQQNLANRLGDQFRADPQHFDALAQKAGLDVKETPLFTFRQVIPDFGNSTSFSNLAFQLRAGEVGPPISVPLGTAIIQLEQIVPEHEQPLDEVRAIVEEDYRAAQSKVLAKEKAKAFADQAKTGDFKAVARSMGLTVKESGDFTQGGSVEGLGPATALDAAFKLDPGKTSDVATVLGNQVVFRVLSRTPANDADFAAQKSSISDQMLQQKRQLVFALYTEDLKQQLMKSGDLKINDLVLKQFLDSYQRQGS